MPLVNSGKKSAATRYAAAGGITIIVALAWISLPLMQKSSLDTSVSYSSNFSGRSSNLRTLGLGVAPEGQAPGSPLTGELVNNPASAPAGIAPSSLYQSQGEGVSAGEQPSAAADVRPPEAGAAKSPARDYSAAAPKAKLTTLPSLSGGGGGSSSAGSVNASRFFGSGNVKAEVSLPSPAEDMKAYEKPAQGAVFSSLQKAESVSAAAAAAPDTLTAKGGASSAFETSKLSNRQLFAEMERISAGGGLKIGQAVKDLKTSDKNLSKKKLQSPMPYMDPFANSDAIFKRMLLQTLISAVLGPAFGAVGGLVSQKVFPDSVPSSYYGTYGQSYPQQYGSMQQQLFP